MESVHRYFLHRNNAIQKFSLGPENSSFCGTDLSRHVMTLLPEEGNRSSVRNSVLVL